MKKIKTYEKGAPTVYQRTITGVIDVYIGSKFLLSCKEEDIKTIQVQFLINKAKQNGL